MIKICYQVYDAVWEFGRSRLVAVLSMLVTGATARTVAVHWSLRRLCEAIGRTGEYSWWC